MVRRFYLLPLGVVMISSLAAVSAGEPAEDGARVRRGRAPRVGEPAPLFRLQSLDGASVTDLASFRGVRPVVLFFGSYT
jgi:hypothetical protein